MAAYVSTPGAPARWLLGVLFSLCFFLPASAQWVSAGSGFTGNSLKVYSLSVADSAVLWALPRQAQFAAATPSFSLSTDGGQTWDSRSFSLADSLTPIHIFALDAQRAWVAATDRADRDGAALLKTNDGGQSWLILPGPYNQPGHNLKAVYFFTPEIGVALGSTGLRADAQANLRIYRSLDGGNTWSELDSLPAAQAGEGTWTDSGNNGYEALGDRLWFGSTTGRVWYSYDAGATWAVSSVGFTGNDSSVSSVAFSDSLHGLAVNPRGQAAATDDGGATWTRLSDLSLPPTPSAIEYVPGTVGTYLVHDGAAFNSRELSFTNDQGQNWRSIDGRFSMDCISFWDRDRGFGGATVTNDSVGGVYRWDGVAPGLTQIRRRPRPAAFSLSPNPAHRQLKLAWTQPGQREVTVLDLQGRVVWGPRTIYRSSAALTLPALPPGLYLLRSFDEEGPQLRRFRVLPGR